MLHWYYNFPDRPFPDNARKMADRSLITALYGPVHSDFIGFYSSFHFWKILPQVVGETTKKTIRELAIKIFIRDCEFIPRRMMLIEGNE